MPGQAKRMTLGLPRMRCEPGERRDFLPAFAGAAARAGFTVFVEEGLGSGMGRTDADYADADPEVRVVDGDTAWAQSLVLHLRCPDARDWLRLRPGAALVSMLHFPTRPERVRRLGDLGIEALSLDSIADDDGRRLVENLRDVAWNGLKASFDALDRTCPGLGTTKRSPVRVTVLGAGGVGKHAVEASLKFGDPARNEDVIARGLPGIEVCVLGRNMTRDGTNMRHQFRLTDILVDATQRRDASRPVIPNAWLSWLPSHAIICDLNVDPYLLHDDPPTVRSVEGIPAGNLDRYVFSPQDPEWDLTIPGSVPSDNRRTVVSCYSWPGIHPERCMERYGRQLLPLLEALSLRGDVLALRPDGPFFERALARASLRRWMEGPSTPVESERPDA